MAKARLTFTVTKEYEFIPEHYGDCETPEEMLAMDIANGEEDPYLSIGDYAEWVITGELI